MVKTYRVNDRITIKSKPFEILESHNPEYLSDAVNKAIELGYEPSWGGIVRGDMPEYGSMFMFMERSTVYCQAVLLKDKKKFDAWIKKEEEERKKIAEQMQKEEKERKARIKKTDKLRKRYINQEVNFHPSNPRAKGGKAIVTHASFIGEIPHSFSLNREIGRPIHASPLDVTFLKNELNTYKEVLKTQRRI